jgi:hypothetical protein
MQLVDRSDGRSLSRLVPLVLFLIACLVPACSEERAPINQVQPNALAKTFFVGEIGDYDDDPEFYMRNTVIDVAAGAGSDGLFTSSDAQPTTRVRFEITQDLLIARLTYELVEHTDGKGTRRTPDGQLVAAFTIDKHFDIRRAYNQATGEESNVVVENDTDRPWNEREYMRVDWSQNLITDAYDLDTLSQLGIYYAVKWSPVAYTVDDPQHPDVPVFDLDRGYFDVTHKALASPEVIEDPEWGDFPACWLIGYFPTISCNPSEITLRQAFLKVVDTDYEPMAIDGTMMDQFGYFTWDRHGYDRRYGVVDDNWRRYATKWNLYERSHAEPMVACNTLETTPVGQDPHRDANGDGTEDECATVGRGSRCDDVVGECTIPLRDRVVKTIAWHVNDDSPADLFEGSARAVESWNRAMRVAVQSGRYAECKRTKEPGCEAQIGFPSPFYGDYEPAKGEGPAAVPDVFVLCHNPVGPGEHEACGEEGTTVRLGDLRYNIFNIVVDVEGMGPWGIMMDAEDPLTGEKIAGSVNEWSHVLDRNASNLVDMLALLNGEIPADQYLTGENVSSWVEKNRRGGAVERGDAVSSAELSRRQASFDPEVMAPYFEGVAKVREGTPPQARHAQRARTLGDAGRLGPGNAALSDRLKRLRGSSLEETLASPEMRQAVGFDPTAVPTTDQVKRASPFGRMNPTIRREEDRKRLLGHAARHSCRLEGPDGDNLIGLARVAQRLFPAPDPSDPAAVLKHREDVFNWARRESSAGVMAHELGHSVGLRHNFAASFDSLNYHPQYWQLRTKNGAVTSECEGGGDGEECIGPRYRDPLTNAEIDGNISRWGTTSVMDYPGEHAQDMNLLGAYDRAAARFAYGGTLDVWADPSISVAASAPTQKGYFATAFTVSPGLFGVNYFPPIDPLEPYVFMHYSAYQREFGVLGACGPSGDADAVLGQKCTGAPLDVVDYRDMQDFVADPDYAQFSWGRNAKTQDAQGRVRHGYMFSSDEYADSGNVPSFSDDAGADAYEQIRFLESAYENRYIFDSFRRNRVQFNSWDVTARVQSRYLDAIQMIAKAFFFGAVLDGDPTLPTEEFLADGNFGPLQVGSTHALDMFARILTRPDPGYYCEAEYCGGVQPVGAAEQIYSADPAPLPQYGTDYYWFQVGLGEGRYLHNDFDYGQGYFWGDYQTQTGSYYDKVWAVYYLAEAFDFFISNSREDFVDSRYKNVNFATVYPKQIDRLFGGLLTGSDYETFAPWANPEIEDGVVHLADIQYPNWSSVDDLGERSVDSFLMDPGWGWNTQIYAMVWGSMFFPTNWSNQWIDQARIAVLASDEPQWPEDETVRFTDPESGIVYRAHSKASDEMFGYTRRAGIAARALERANTLAAWSYLVEVDDDGIPLFEDDGQPVYVLDDDGKPQLDPDFAYANADLRRYIDTLDLFRQLVATFEQPIHELPDP